MTAKADWPTKAKQEQYWKEHIARYMQSGCSQTAYCRQEGLNKRAFSYWKTKLCNPTPESGFIPVRICMEKEEDRGSQPAALHLQIGHRYRIEIGEGFNPATLERLVKTLERSL